MGSEGSIAVQDSELDKSYYVLEIPEEQTCLCAQKTTLRPRGAPSIGSDHFGSTTGRAYPNDNAPG